MRYGVILPQTEIGPDPRDVVAFVRAAEDSGFEFVVVYDHVLGADSRVRPGWQGAYDATDQFHEPFVLYGYLAAHTSMELVTGVLVLPQRQTSLVAKQAAEVDILTSGRLRLGVGIGWNEVEYEALGVDFDTRAQRYEEQIGLLRRLWTEDIVTFEGRFDRVESAGILPRPIQRPIPIWMGGGTGAKVVDRIGRLGDGWLALHVPGRGLEQAWERLTEAARTAGRNPTEIGLQGRIEPGADRGDERLRSQLDRWLSFEPTTHLAISGLHAGRTPREHVAFVEQAGRAVFG